VKQVISYQLSAYSQKLDTEPNPRQLLVLVAFHVLRSEFRVPSSEFRVPRFPFRRWLSRKDKIG